MYGDYNLVITTVSILTLLVISWLSHSVYRYVNDFSEKNDLQTFFSTVFITWAVVIGVLMSVAFLLILLFKGSLDKTTAVLFFTGTFMMLTNSAVLILLSVLGAARIIKLNLILSVFSAAAKLILTSIIVLNFNLGILSALISFLIVDFSVISIVVIRLKIYSFINLNLYSKSVISKFLKYGFPLVGLSLSMSILNLSDRYLIKFIMGSEEVGIYAANYTIASAVFTMINFAVMRGIYPMILKNWNKDNKELTEELLSHAVRFYIIIALPCAAGLSILSSTISKILDPAYTTGSSVIIWVSAGMFLYGLTEYNNKAWELNSSTSTVFKNSLICSGFNILCNIVLIPFLGFMAAAINTALAFLLLFILSYRGSRSILKWNISKESLLKIVGSAFAMILILGLIVVFLNPGKLALVFLVILGASIYGGGLYLTGEIKSEVYEVIQWAQALRKNNTNS